MELLWRLILDLRLRSNLLILNIKPDSFLKAVGFIFVLKKIFYIIFDIYLYHKCYKKVTKMIQEIIAYKNILESIEGLIEKSAYKKNYIIEKVGISSPTFYRKLKTQSFTPDEVLSIAKILSPEENFMLDLKADIEQGKLDLKNGDFITHEEMLAELKSKNLI